MPTPPTFSKVNPADSPILYLALSSPTLPLSTVDEYGETLMAQRISMVSGVAQVLVFGSAKYAVRAQLDPNALATRGIGIEDVRQAIADANVNLPTGTLYGFNQAFTVQATGQLMNAAAYRPLIVAYRNGSPVHLDEIGRVIDSQQNDKVASWFNGVRAIVLAIQRQPGTNTVEVVDSIKKLLPKFRMQIPASVSIDIIYDRSESIRNSVDDVKFTLLLTVCLVVMVIFLFLRNVSATIIPSLALPMSIIGTFAAMYLFGYSLDNLSLMALTLSVGFVVDDAIVILENIVRHMEMGERPMEAALNGSREIGFTIISMTLSLAAVFIPVLFMGGILGRLFHEFAVTIGVAILVSGFVSLTLTPMLCSRFLRPPGEQKHGGFYRGSERVFQGMLNLYDWTLRGVLRARALAMLVSFALLVVTGYLFVVIPKGFIPNQDTGQIFGFTEAAQDISYEGMVKHQRAIAAVVNKDPRVIAAMSSVGRGGAATGNTGVIFLHLRPRNERPSADEIINELRPKFGRLPGIQAYMQVPPLIRIGGQLTKSLYQYTMQSSDMNEPLPLGAHYRRQDARPCRARGCHKRSADPQPAGSGNDRSRQGIRTRRERRRDRKCALRCLRLAPGLDHIHAEQRILGDHGARAAVSARSGGALGTLCAWEFRAAGAAECGRKISADGRTLAGDAPWAGAVGHHFVQSQAGRIARRCSLRD